MSFLVRMRGPARSAVFVICHLCFFSNDRAPVDDSSKTKNNVGKTALSQIQDDENRLKHYLH